MLKRGDFTKLTVLSIVMNLKEAVTQIREEQVANNTWDDLKQLRFEGLVDICDNIADIDLRTIADMCYPWGLSPKFELSDKGV